MGAGPPERAGDRTDVRDRARVVRGARRRADRVGRGGRGREGRRAGRRAGPRCWPTTGRRDVAPRRRRPRRGRGGRHAVRDDVQPSLIYEEYAIAGEIVKADPAWRAALARARHHRLRERSRSTRGRPATSAWRGRRGGASCAPCRCGATRPTTTATPIRSRAWSPSSTSTSAASCGSTTTASCRSRPTPAATTPSRTGPGGRPCDRSRSCSRKARASRSTATPSAGTAGASRRRCTRSTGLVLHDVAWVADGAVRSVLKRASLAEMIVPYGDVSPDHGFKHVMDVGEYGFGPFANSLTLGCDCLGEIRYLDAHFALPDGDVLTTKNAICIHEEDYGILWKHSDHCPASPRCGAAGGSSSRPIHTVGNYEYGIFWYLYLDGTIQLEMKLTGILNTSADRGGRRGAARPPDRPPAGRAAPPAPVLRPPRPRRRRHRQHGRPDRLRGPPGRAGQPVRSAFVARETPLRARVRGRRRRLLRPRPRYWEVRSASKRNAYGEPTGYRLKLGHGTTPLLAPAGRRSPTGARSRATTSG